jgi:hypothetical protein
MEDCGGDPSAFRFLHTQHLPGNLRAHQPHRIINAGYAEGGCQKTSQVPPAIARDQERRRFLPIISSSSAWDTSPRRLLLSSSSIGTSGCQRTSHMLGQATNKQECLHQVIYRRRDTFSLCRNNSRYTDCAAKRFMSGRR